MTKDRENKNVPEIKQMKRRNRGEMEGIDRMTDATVGGRQSPEWAPRSLPRSKLHYSACYILQGLGWVDGCPMCLNMRKICYSHPSVQLTHKHTHLTLEVWNQIKYAQHEK